VEQTPLPRIKELDGLRAIAVALVIMFHFDLPVPGGFFGVDLFFALSGFVIARQLLHTSQDDGVSANARLLSFYRRRALRLLPNALALCVAVVVGSLVFPGQLGDPGRNLRHAIAGIAGLGNWFPLRFPDTWAGETRPLLHLWSLSIEEQFYLVLAPVLLLCRRRSRDAATLFGVATVTISIGSAMVGQSPLTAYFSTWPRLAPIGFGVLVAVAFTDRSRVARLERLPGKASMLAALFAALGVLCLGTKWDAEWLRRGGFVVTGLGFAAIVALCAVENNSRSGRAVSQLLCTRLFQGIGHRSYALYLWHFPLALVFNDIAPAPRFLLRVALTLALSEASLLLIEKPLRNTHRFSAARFTPFVMVATSIGLFAWGAN
jgi:peptidoglycan/LPS O-acetylase OafA/YrhL